MSQKIKQQKTFLIKFLSVFLSVALVIGIAPTSVFSNLWVSAEEEPQYGTYTVSGKTLTAVPNEGAAFRGWYDKNGQEVSYNLSYTIPDGASTSDYTPKFYNFNLVDDSGFENGNSDGKWQGSGFSFSTEQKRNGTKSLKMSTAGAYAYASFIDLEAETQYTLSYYYKGNALSGFVVGGDTVSSSDFESYIYKGKYFSKNIGAATSNWQKVLHILLKMERM